MIQDALGKLEGISVKEININNISLLKKLQKIIDSVNKACKAYEMEINVKETKVMVQCKVLLIQAERYNTWVAGDLKCGEEFISRIGLAFWKNKELLRRIINCYIFSVLNYGVEYWTWSMELKKRVVL